MRSTGVGSIGIALGILFAFFFAAQGEAPAEEVDFASCGGWVNCSAESPNYTGICCRVCEDQTRGRFWNCKQVRADRQSFGVPSAGLPSAREATIAGIVTKEGLLHADRGPTYAVSGAKAEELQKNMGKKIEVKGTVQEQGGKVTIDVEAYEWMGVGEAGPALGAGSCGEWLNCDSRPPTYTGTCCRRCEAAGWDCRVFSLGEHFDLAEWSH